MNEPVRIEKHLAQTGLASRRHAAEWVRAGRVAVNGTVVTEPGRRVCLGTDTLAVDGRAIGAPPATARTVVLYKPRGYICSASDADGRTVYDLLPRTGERLVPVGRLDKNSEGLLLLSNDGALVNRLTHPRYASRKVYVATVSGSMNPQTFKVLQAPIEIDGEFTRPAGVRLLRKGTKPGRYMIEFTLQEGRNRQIRRLCEAAGLFIHRLVRTRIRGLTIAGLRPGAWRDLTAGEAADLARDEQPDAPNP